MNTHHLKTDSDLFEKSLEGIKKFEIRLNDRNYSVGDVLILKETKFSGSEMKEGKPLEYTGRTKVVSVSYILEGYGLKENWVVMGVMDVDC